MKISEDVLKKLYIKDELSLDAISISTGINRSTIYWYLKKFNIPMRNISNARKISFSSGRSIITEKFLNSVRKNVIIARKGITDISRKKQSVSIKKRYDNGLVPWNFKEGSQNELNRRVRRPRWMQLSKLIRERDNNICRICNKTKSIMQVHHVDGDEDNNSYDNLITVCASCHMKETWKLGQMSRQLKFK